MQMFYVIISRDSLYLYEKSDEGYERQYIAGNSEFYYQINSVKKDIEKMMDALAEDYNLENRSGLSFTVVGNSDPFITETVSKAFEEYIADRIDLYVILPEIINKLSTDKKLLVEEYGVNFEGVNYCMAGGALQTTDYSLLGYTLQPDDLIGLIA